MPRPRKLGADAEKRAAEFLRNLGYTIITRNYKRGRSEIDIIAMDGGTVVFVEVRSRRPNRFQTAEESVDIAKMDRLWETADQFLAESEADKLNTRFDIVAIEGLHVRHYKDAFRAD